MLIPGSAKMSLLNSSVCKLVGTTTCSPLILWRWKMIPSCIDHIILFPTALPPYDSGQNPTIASSRNNTQHALWIHHDTTVTTTHNTSAMNNSDKFVWKLGDWPVGFYNTERLYVFVHHLVPDFRHAFSTKPNRWHGYFTKSLFAKSMMKPSLNWSLF